MAKKRIKTREDLWALALSLDLPHVVETTSWGEPMLKAHGKMWAWWSPSAHVPVFKTAFAERDFLIDIEPETFFVTPHYKGHQLVLARPEKLDPDWARARLIKTWRDMAPKKVLKAYDEAQGVVTAKAPVRKAAKKTPAKRKAIRKRA
jgi:hypothetical protein